MSGGDQAFAARFMSDVLRERGWTGDGWRDETRFALAHRCGSRVSVAIPSVSRCMTPDEAVGALHAACDAVECYCVPAPPPEWDPDDDLPATRGDLKRIEKLIRGMRGGR